MGLNGKMILSVLRALTTDIEPMDPIAIQLTDHCY